MNPTPTPPAGAEPSPEAMCVAHKIFTYDRLLRERTDGHDACYAEEAAIFIDAALAPLRDELERVKGERDALVKDINGVVEECGKHITLSNDFPWSEEVFCALSSLARDGNQLRSDLTAARARIGELERERENSRSIINEKDTAFADMIAAGNELSKQVDEDRATIADLERKVDELKRMVRENYDSANAYMEISTKVRGDNDHLTLELAALRSQVEQHRETHTVMVERQETDAMDIGSLMAENATLRAQLALANATAEEARRAGVKTFDESHPDDLKARIHATIKEHERLWMNGGYIYLSSYLAKAIFEMLDQPLK